MEYRQGRIESPYAARYALGTGEVWDRRVHGGCHGHQIVGMELGEEQERERGERGERLEKPYFAENCNKSFSVRIYPYLPFENSLCPRRSVEVGN